MAKMVKKSKLHMENGFVCDKKGNIVALPCGVAAQANTLESKLQQHRYLAAQPEAAPMPSLDGWKRQSQFDELPEVFYDKTPTIDARIEEAKKFAEEMQHLYDMEEANKILRMFKELLKFAAAEKVVVGDSVDSVTIIDTPLLGNILELTEADIVHAVMETFGYGNYDLYVEEVEE